MSVHHTRAWCLWRSKRALNSLQLEEPCGASVRTVSALNAGSSLQPLIAKWSKSQHRSQPVRSTTEEREAGGLCGLLTRGAGGLRKNWQTPRSFAVQPPLPSRK